MTVVAGMMCFGGRTAPLDIDIRRRRDCEFLAST